MKIWMLNRKRKALDRYKNNVVMGFSYYKLFSSYTGYCVKVRRSSDDATQDFGFVDGYLDTASILAFCGAGSGYVHTWYNQYAAGNDAIQTTLANQPRIVNSGAFEVNGIYFGGSNNLDVSTYTVIDSVITPPLSYYINYKPNSGSGYIFLKADDAGSNKQIGFSDQSASNVGQFYINNSAYNLTCLPSSQNKALLNWIGTGANQASRNINGTETLFTHNVSPLTNYTYITLGCRMNTVSGRAAFYVGNLKTIVIASISMEYNIVSKC